MKHSVLIFLFIFSQTLVKAQDDPFIVGVYFPDTLHTIFMDSCLSMGVNELMAPVTSNNYTYYQNSPFMLIPMAKHNSGDTTKWYQAYTGGHYYRWQLERESDGNRYGFLYRGGGITDESGDSCWTNKNDFYNYSTYVVIGPASRQEKLYTKVELPSIYPEEIHYNIKIKYKVEIEGTIPDSMDIMNIYYRYRYWNKTTQHFEQTTIKEPDIIHTEVAGAGFQFIEDTYDLDIFPINSINPYPSGQGSTEDDKYSDLCDRCGFFIECDYLGSPPGSYINVFLDYVEITGQSLGEPLLNSSNHGTIEQSIINSITEFDLGSTRIIHWAGYDEPGYVDLYTPYRITDSLMQDLSHSKKRDIISPFYPSWSNINGVPRRDRFNHYFQIAAPDTLMFDLYPLNPNKDSTNLEDMITAFYHYREVVDMAAMKGHDLFPVIQAHEFTGGQELRRPSAEELECMTNICLSMGADAIHYFKLWDGRDGKNAILNTDCTGSSLFYKIKYDIAPRLNTQNAQNVFQPTEFAKELRTLEYTGNYEIAWKTEYLVSCDDSLATDVESGISWVDIDMEKSNHFYYLITELDPEHSYPDQPEKFLYVINMMTVIPYWKNVTITLDLPFPFCNTTVTNFETDEKIAEYHQNGHDVNLSLDAGKGQLWKVEARVSCGGDINLNDTIVYPISLLDTLTIVSNNNLVIKDDYTIEADIIIEDSAEISIGKFGNIILDGGNLYFTDWDGSLLLMEENNHPKLVWGVHPSLSPIQYYKIYRKIGDGNWGYITNTTGNSWVDSTYYVFQPGMPRSDTAYYKVTGYGGSGRPQESGFSNTVNIRIGTGEMQKRNNGLIVTEYALQQNYPNPFNPETTIKYQLPETSEVKLVIYDMLGRKVTTLVDETKEMGYYSVKFDGSALSSGMYMYKITAGKFSATKKMLLVK